MSIFAMASEKMALISVRRKVDIILFILLIVFPMSIMFVAQSQGTHMLNNLLAGWLVASIILFIPFSKGMSHLVALRNIRDLNNQCYRLKKGDFALAELPPERGEEHDFLRLRRNLHWMGYAIAAREQKLSSAMSELAEAQHHIQESIDYASVIQSSFLPDPRQFDTLFRDHFILWDQRDKVGGDSLWFQRMGNGFFLGVIDCTGHGVPGAFMTLIVNSLFEKALTRDCMGNPGKVLSKLNCLIKDELGQNDDNAISNDGLDCSLCYIEPLEKRIIFSGANNPLFLQHNGEVQEVKGDRCGIGYVRSPREFVFMNREITWEPGMRLFMSTDGIIDQIGGEKRFPFGKRRLKQFFVDNANRPLREMGPMLEQTMNIYRSDEPRRDDVTVLGFEI